MEAEALRAIVAENRQLEQNLTKEMNNTFLT